MLHAHHLRAQTAGTNLDSSQIFTERHRPVQEPARASEQRILVVPGSRTPSRVAKAKLGKSFASPITIERTKKPFSGAFQ
jgi:hypothetical protein